MAYVLGPVRRAGCVVSWSRAQGQLPTARTRPALPRRVSASEAVRDIGESAHL